jgi:hypothetical protein
MGKAFGGSYSYRPFIVFIPALLVFLIVGGGLGFFGCLLTVFVCAKLFQVWDKLKAKN